MLWNLISRTGLIVVRTRWYSQFCPRVLKLECFSSHTVLPSELAALPAGWVMLGGSLCPPAPVQRLSRQTKMSLDLLTPPMLWGGVPSDREEIMQLGRYKRNMYRSPETSVSPQQASAQCFGHLDNMGKMSAKLKLGWELAFHVPLHGNFLDSVNERCLPVSVRLGFNFRFSGAESRKQRLPLQTKGLQGGILEFTL